MDPQAPNFITTVLSHMDPASVFQYGYTMARQLLPWATLIMVLSVIFRTVQEQYNAAVSSKSNWAKYFLDILLWGGLLVGYFALSIPTMKFFNALYSWAEANGSMDTINAQISGTLNRLHDLPTDQSTFAKVWGALESTTGYTAYLVSWFLYSVTFLIVVSVSALMKLGHALLFNIAFIWGLFVIPLNITLNIKLLRPWATAMGFLLLWPFFLAILIYFTQNMFIGAANVISEQMGAFSLVAETTLYMAFAVLNIILTALLIVAPLVAQSFMSGSGMTASVLAFASAGLATARMAYETVAKPYGVVSSAVDKVQRGVANTTFDRSMREIGHHLRSLSPPSGGGGATPTPGGGGSGGGQGAASSPSSGGGGSGSSAGGPAVNGAGSGATGGGRSGGSGSGASAATAANASHAASSASSASPSRAAQGSPRDTGTAKDRYGASVQTQAIASAEVADVLTAPVSPPYAEHTAAAQVQNQARAKRPARAAREGVFINKAKKKARGQS